MDDDSLIPFIIQEIRKKDLKLDRAGFAKWLGMGFSADQIQGIEQGKVKPDNHGTALICLHLISRARDEEEKRLLLKASGLPLERLEHLAVKEIHPPYLTGREEVLLRDLSRLIHQARDDTRERLFSLLTEVLKLGGQISGLSQPEEKKKTGSD